MNFVSASTNQQVVAANFINFFFIKINSQICKKISTEVSLTLPLPLHMNVTFRQRQSCPNWYLKKELNDLCNHIKYERN